MMFFTIILIIFILLVLISIVNTFIFLALNLVTRVKYPEHYLVLPSFLILITWFMAYFAIKKIFSLIIGTSILGSVSASIFNTSSFTINMPKLVLPILAILILTLLLQSLALLAVNIDYNKVYNKIRYYIKRIFKKQNDQKQNQDITEVDNKYKLTFSNSFTCNLFIFTLLFFLSIIFFWIGTLIGNKMV